MINSGHIIKPEHISQDMYKVLFNTGIEKYSLGIDMEKPLDKILADIEKSLISKVLSETSGNISKSAQRLGIKRQTLQHKLKKYNIQITE